MVVSQGLRRQIETDRSPYYGIFLYSGEATFAEAAAVAGVRFLVVDMEASPMSDRDALTVLQTLSGTACSPLVRVPRHDPHLVGHALDIGAAGVVIPRVDTAAEAASMGSACRYPPDGTRGLNALRASAYGHNEPAYLAEANRRAFCVVQVESPAAVNAAREIAAVATVDSLFIGIGDLALSYGAPGLYDAPDVVVARRRVLTACADANKIPGIFAPSTRHAAQFADEGFQLIAVGNEVRHFLSGLSGALSDLNGLRGKSE
jgi:2-keto-3-deoxy-L-rhamnonate aldolase RhmA